MKYLAGVSILMPSMRGITRFLLSIISSGLIFGPNLLVAEKTVSTDCPAGFIVDTRYSYYAPSSMFECFKNVKLAQAAGYKNKISTQKLKNSKLMKPSRLSCKSVIGIKQTAEFGAQNRFRCFKTEQLAKKAKYQKLSTCGTNNGESNVENMLPGKDGPTGSLWGVRFDDGKKFFAFGDTENAPISGGTLLNADGSLYIQQHISENGFKAVDASNTSIEIQKADDGSLDVALTLSHTDPPTRIYGTIVDGEFKIDPLSSSFSVKSELSNFFPATNTPSPSE